MKGVGLFLKLLLLAAVVLSLWALSSISVTACGDDEECLVWGENCTQDYKLENYGTTEIYCCSGQCDDHGSGILTCGT